MKSDKSEHLNEALLERLALDDATLGDEREGIELHLRTCEGCSERFQEIKEYFGEVHGLVQMHRQALTTTERVLPIEREPRQLREEFVRVPQWNPIARTFIRYPAASSVGVVGLLAVMLFLLLRTPRRDGNPAFVQAKEGFLVSFNAQGEALFRKQIYPEADFESIKRGGGLMYSAEHYMTVADVDGDGTNEIFVHWGWLTRPEKNSIVCLNANGTVRWQFEFNRTLAITSESVPDDFMCSYFSVKDFDGDGKLDVVALFRHSTYSPTAILRLDASTGKLQGEYWHAGWLYQIAECPGSTPGVTMIVTGGTNNGFRLADVLMLDPRHLSGQAPSSEGFTIANVGKGSQVQYILFPRSGPELFMTQLYNRVNVVQTANDQILVLVDEQFQRQGHVVAMVQLDLNMKILNVTSNNDFQGYLETLQKNHVPGIHDAAYYLSRFRSGIRIWNGAAFISESESLSSLLSH